MSTYDFVHLALMAMDGEVRGKTKLQKTVYFLGIMTGQIDELGYSPHYYGPYSSQVKEAVNRLAALGFVAHNSIPFGGVDRSGFEMARHDYRLTDDGQVVARQKAVADPELWERLSRAAGTLRAAGDQDYMLMSVAAKTYFIVTQKGRKTTTAEVAEAAKQLGWNPSTEEIQQAGEYLVRMGLLQAG